MAPLERRRRQRRLRLEAGVLTAIPPIRVRVGQGGVEPLGEPLMELPGEGVVVILRLVRDEYCAFTEVHEVVERDRLLA